MLYHTIQKQQQSSSKMSSNRVAQHPRLLFVVDLNRLKPTNAKFTTPISTCVCALHDTNLRFIYVYGWYHVFFFCYVSLAWYGALDGIHKNRRLNRVRAIRREKELYTTPPPHQFRNTIFLWLLEDGVVLMHSLYVLIRRSQNVYMFDDLYDRLCGYRKYLHAFKELRLRDRVARSRSCLWCNIVIFGVPHIPRSRH